MTKIETMGSLVQEDDNKQNVRLERKIETIDKPATNKDVFVTLDIAGRNNETGVSIRDFRDRKFSGVKELGHNAKEYIKNIFKSKEHTWPRRDILVSAHAQEQQAQKRIEAAQGRVEQLQSQAGILEDQMRQANEMTAEFWMGQGKVPVEKTAHEKNMGKAHGHIADFGLKEETAPLAVPKPAVKEDISGLVRTPLGARGVEFSVLKDAQPEAAAAPGPKPVAVEAVEQVGAEREDYKKIRQVLERAGGLVLPGQTETLVESLRSGRLDYNTREKLIDAINALQGSLGEKKIGSAWDKENRQFFKDTLTILETENIQEIRRDIADLFTEMKIIVPGDEQFVDRARNGELSDDDMDFGMQLLAVHTKRGTAEQKSKFEQIKTVLDKDWDKIFPNTAKSLVRTRSEGVKLSDENKSFAAAS